MPGATDDERIRRMQVLSDALDAQRKETTDTWSAATTGMNAAWTAVRNEDRRLMKTKHVPERRKR
jgi:hypothetical protein